jgi:tetratricopeptide (TPR) repeat protein
MKGFLGVFICVTVLAAVGCAQGIVSPRTGSQWSLDQALDAQQRGQFEAALLHYDNYLRSNLHNPENLAVAYHNRGLLYADLKEWDRAEENFDKAVESAGADNWQHLLARGLFLFDRQQYRRAIADFDGVVLQKPNLGQAYYSRGLCWKNLGESEKALEDFTRARELAPR